MPYAKRRPADISAADLAEQSQRDELAILAEIYESVRSIPGHARDVAYRDLGIALARFRAQFTYGVWAYQWSREQDSIMRMPATGYVRPKAVYCREEEC